MVKSEHWLNFYCSDLPVHLAIFVLQRDLELVIYLCPTRRSVMCLAQEVRRRKVTGCV